MKEAKELVAVAKELVAGPDIIKDAHIDGTKLGFGWAINLYVSAESFDSVKFTVEDFEKKVDEDIRRIATKINQMGGWFVAKSKTIVFGPKGRSIPIGVNATFHSGELSRQSEVLDYISRVMKARIH